jgi:hypothetical protein
MGALTKDCRVVDVPVKGTLWIFPRYVRPARLRRMQSICSFSVSRLRSHRVEMSLSFQRIFSPPLRNGLINASQKHEDIFSRRLNRTADKGVAYIKEMPEFCRYQVKYNRHRTNDA